MIREHPLPGCTPTPLASYLKALAVLRLVAEADTTGGGDPTVTGFWRDDVFVLRTTLERADVVRFFLDRYRPTPLIAPWNGGSGFYFQERKLKDKDPNTGKKLKTGVRDQETEATKTVAKISACSSSRFSDYREAIAVAKKIVSELNLVEAPENTPTNKNKNRFVQMFRNLASDRCLRAVDCAVVIAGDEVTFPPLLGTGGNDGNLDFTNNFMQRLLEVLDVSGDAALPGAAASLESALFATPCNSHAKNAIGQFAPGAAGGPNAATAFNGEGRINPWDFVLMLEGAMVFAASVARRLEHGDRAIPSAPFVVRSRMGTEGAASASDDEDSRNEMWMPLWAAPCTFDEIQSLLKEGRVTLSGRAARDGLDFARAVAQLGINRGIGSFQRYGFLKRQGKNFLATPLSRVEAHRHPDADLIVELDRRNWLPSVQRFARDENAPNAVRSAARLLDAALFALTQRASRNAIQAVLHKVSLIDLAVSANVRAQDAVRTPAPRLSLPWATKADDQTTEYRIASALASLRLRNAVGAEMLHARRHLIRCGEPRKGGDREWEPESRVAVWGTGSLVNNVVTLLRRRQLDACKLGLEGDLIGSHTGATLVDVAAFLDGSVDDVRIGELFGGLACVDWNGAEPPQDIAEAVLPPAFALLKVFFTSEALLRARGYLPPDVALRLPAEIPARMAADDVSTAVRVAWQRMRAIGVRLPGRHPPRILGVNGKRWLAALCIPLTYVATSRLLGSLDLALEVETDFTPLPEVIAE